MVLGGDKDDEVEEYNNESIDIVHEVQTELLSEGIQLEKEDDANVTPEHQHQQQQQQRQ